MGSTVARLFNDKQAELEIICLFCCWDFSETEEDRSLVLRKIGLEPFIHSLLKLDVTRANEASLGCLVQYEI